MTAAFDCSTWPEPGILIARHNTGISWNAMAGEFGCSSEVVRKYVGMGRHTDTPPESYEARMIAMDVAFCAAMTAAIKSGLEWAPIGIAPVPVDAVLRKTIYAPPRFSFCGSSSALCADMGELSR